jgi:hypothetical protein
MITEQSQNLINLSQQKIKLQENAKHLEGFKTRQEQIEKAINTIYLLINLVKVFRQKGIANFDLTETVSKLLKFIQLAQTEFNKNPEWILDNNNFNGNYLQKSVDKLANQLQDQLKQTWQNYLKQKMPTTNPDLLNLLEKVASFKDTVTKIKRLDQLIKEYDYPQSKEEFNNIEQWINNLRESWENLNSDQVPDAVIRFLRAAANQGASLNLLTDEVKDWIIQHGLYDSIRIRLS